jgi:hypothetical protein
MMSKVRAPRFERPAQIGFVFSGWFLEPEGQEFLIEAGFSVQRGRTA